MGLGRSLEETLYEILLEISSFQSPLPVEINSLHLIPPAKSAAKLCKALYAREVY